MAGRPVGERSPTGTLRAVVLLSGGLDSATALAWAVRRDGCEAHALAFDYGQRHRVELDAARRVADSLGVKRLDVVRIDAGVFAGASALTGGADVPKDRAAGEMAHGIPVTYVPARNLLFLAHAAAVAEARGAGAVYLGVNAIDYSGYPDCRPEFIAAFEAAARLGTKAGVEGRPLEVRAPLATLSKAGIIREGVSLGVDYALTHSCYDPRGDLACGRCDSCLLRSRGFAEAGVADPTRYAP